MLVHMAPEEVSGLQALAKAAGGTLTLNPDTGLPEANFLKRMLPMIIGAGITAATGGAAAPWMLGLGMGGFETLRTGSLEKGLMAGLGAYGGAGLAGGLLGAGAGAAQQAAVTGAGQGASQAAMNQAAAEATKQAVASPLSTMGAGIKSLGTEAGRSAALSSMGGGMGAAKYGLAALSPTLQADAPTPYAGSGPNPYEYSYDPATQQYTRVAPGSRARDMLAPTTPMMAAGGPIEEMSDRNQMETMMANGGQMFAAGGQVNLQGTFTAGDQGSGQFGQANANGYQAAGSGGPIQGFSSSFGQMGSGKSNQIFSGGFGTPGGIDPRAVQADPQGFQRWMQGAQQQEQQVPGSTFLNSNTQGSSPGQLQALQQQMRSGGFGGYGQAMSRPSGPGGGMMSGMGGTAENGFMSPGGNGSTAGGLMEQLQQMQKDQANSTYGGGMGGSNATPLAHVLQPSENRLGSLGRKHPSEYTLEETLRAQQSRFAQGGMASMARGGPSHLGDYSDGGRLLKGPGDGVSDSIPATIANKRPARLADGEFVVPARIVSELGNGSTEAGARKLYAMMDRVQKARGKTTGKDRVAVNSRAEKLLPA
jgi:hypothetical protein